MFTWICPQCGREVPPSESECPTCAENAKRAAAPPVAPPPPTYAQQQYQQPAPPQAPAPPIAEWQPQQPLGGAQPVYILPGSTPARRSLPTWLMVPGIAVLVIAVLFGVYRMVGGKTDVAVSTSAKTESVADPGAASSSPYAKVIEVAGLRVTEDAKQKARVQMVVVNHSPADIPDLELSVTIRTVSSKSTDEPIAVVKTKIGTLAANGYKEVSEPLTTKLRAYELPDWQFLRASVDVVSPK